jgi:septal ring factor EnvC (AmiA/AmiB activator)
MTTNTPRTDAAFGQGKHGVMKIPYETSCKLELELAAYKAEVAEIRSALGDDGRRTHKEILEMAFKASGWKVWKEKYIDLRNAHIAEGQDPAGTIWEHADKLQKELKEAKAEIAKLNHQLLKTESDLLQSQDINSFLDAEFRIACKRAEKAEEEVERLKANLRRVIEIADVLRSGGSRACRELHHPKRDQHEYAEVCPVEERLEKASEELDGLKASLNHTDK